MKSIRNLYLRISNDPDKIGFDQHLVILTCILAILAFAVGLLINLLLPLGMHIRQIAVAGLAVFMFLYYLARFRERYRLVKTLFIILLPLFLDVLWFTNYGSSGPIIYIYIVAYTGFMFFLDGKQLMFYGIFFLINTTGMFLLEYFYPELLLEYPDFRSQIIDVYSGLLIYLMIATLLMVYIKQGYIHERDKAKNAEKLKSSFLANMSHEIRTPLNSILGFNQLIEKKISDESILKYTRQIEKNSTYLLQILEDILEVSRLEAGEITIEKSPVVIKELFDDVYFLLTNHYNVYIQSRAKISYNIIPEDLTTFSDYTRLKQILLNLLTNAMKYTDINGYIEYTCIKKDKFLEFRVKDNGVGIAEKYHRTIFERFSKIETNNKPGQPGTGIGLSITKELVNLLDGSIRLISGKNSGAEFIFLIPHEKTLRSN